VSAGKHDTSVLKLRQSATTKFTIQIRFLFAIGLPLDAEQSSSCLFAFFSHLAGFANCSAELKLNL